MIHRLLNFGDSWAYGAELPAHTREQNNYAGQLGPMLAVDSVEHFALPGSSASHMVVQFHNFLDKFWDECNSQQVRYTAVFFLTAKQRYMIKCDGQWVFLTPLGASAVPSKSDQLARQNHFYFKYVYDEEHCDLMFNNDLTVLQSLCRQYNINDYYIAGWQEFKFNRGVDVSKIYNRGATTCAELIEMQKNSSDTFDPDPNNAYLHPNRSHPNELGHRKIAEYLYQWIGHTE